ncbi:hypothetical protein J2780_000395 [Chryseobacterium camelliae]|nr:hypothetical protein [Chryseobacterium camelliae]
MTKYVGQPDNDIKTLAAYHSGKGFYYVMLQTDTKWPLYLLVKRPSTKLICDMKKLHFKYPSDTGDFENYLLPSATQAFIKMDNR